MTQDIQLQVIEKALRQKYLDLVDQGLTHARIAEVSGLPRSQVTMWLRGYRPLVKLATMQALVDACAELEREAVLS